MSFAPVALFCFNRTDHLKQSVTALQQNTLARNTDVIFFSDGPRNNSEIPTIQEIRSYLKTVQGFNSVTVVEQPKNKGLANSIIDGVTELLQTHNQLIVLEDDLVSSPHFLSFMNDALELYKDDSRFASVHGYCYPVGETLPDTFFLKGADCWGWATTAQAWKVFNANGSELLTQIKENNLVNEFDFNGAYPYTKMLQKQIEGKNNSWAIRWYASAFLNNMFTLYPGKSLVKNIGADSSGTHFGTTSYFDVDISNAPVTLIKKEINEDLTAKEIIASYFKRTSGNVPWYLRLSRILKRLG